MDSGELVEGLKAWLKAWSEPVSALALMLFTLLLLRLEWKRFGARLLIEEIQEGRTETWFVVHVLNVGSEASAIREIKLLLKRKRVVSTTPRRWASELHPARMVLDHNRILNPGERALIDFRVAVGCSLDDIEKLRVEPVNGRAGRWSARREDRRIRWELEGVRGPIFWKRLCGHMAAWWERRRV